MEALRNVGEKISGEDVENEFMPLIKRMKKGDLYSMRISATFLYAYIYHRLDSSKKATLRSKFTKLSKDDTPMVRRASAQSIALISSSLEAEQVTPFLLPVLK